MKGIVLSLLPVLLVACGNDDSELQALLQQSPADTLTVAEYMVDPLAVARGESIFLGTCATFCHTTFPDEAEPSYLFDCRWEHGSTDREIFDVVTHGIPNTEMVGFGSNFPEGDADLWKLIAYLRVNQQSCEPD